MLRSVRPTGPNALATPPLPLLGVSVAASGLAATLVLTHHRIPGGVAAAIAGLALLLGTVRARRAGEPAALFGERVVDRIFDAGVLAPLAWVARHGDERVAALALFGLGAAFLASYERARGQSLGYRGSEGVGYRAVRVAILAAALLTGRLEPLLWVFLALTVAAAAVRAWNVALQQRGSTARMEGAP
jgi:hypothetical protein